MVFMGTGGCERSKFLSVGMEGGMGGDGTKIFDGRKIAAKEERLFPRYPVKFPLNSVMFVVIKIAKRGTLSVYKIIKNVNWDPIKQTFRATQ